jgi:zinc protease
MKRVLLSLTAIAMLCSPYAAKAQAKLIEKVTKKGNEVVIPYEKYVLPNGLTILVHEDHSDPIVHVDVTYHVGSAREEIGKSGFAHFFEHMMFQGSDHVGDEQHFKIISEAGGTLNGSTNRDRTNYFETVPANQLEKMLWLEADRMGFLLDAVTQPKFEVQRSTVKNERGQRYDNVPYGLVNEVTAKNLYPYGHPYSWLTIGYVEDLNRVNVNDLKNFFLRWYGPNNAVLTVGGDVKTQDVVKMAEKYFGAIPKGPSVEPVKVPAPVLDRDRYISMQDNYAKLPLVRLVYPTTPEFSKDEAPLDCLAEILGQGKNSIFYKNFVKAQKAVSAAVYNSTSELSGEFVLTVTPFPGQKLSDMEQQIRQSLAEFEVRGVTNEDIEKFKSQREAQTIERLESVSGKVSRLAAFQTYTGNANYIGKEIARYTSVTKEDVMRVYNQYIKGKHAVIVSVLTKGNESNKAAEDNYTVSTSGYKAPNYGYDNLKYVKAKDNFDRSKMPGIGANPVVTVPAFWKDNIGGSINAIGTKSDEIPVVSIQLKFKGGKMMDANNPGKSGLANMTTTMMDEDTKNYSSEDFSTALEKLGSTIDVYTSDDATVVNVQSLRKHLDKTLSLLEERLLRPKFTQEAFTMNKKRAIESIKNSMNRANYVASTVYPKVLYGADNVLGWSVQGTEKTIQNIELKDVEDYYRNYISKRDAQVIVVGDIKKEDILPKLAFLQQLSDGAVSLPELKPVPQIAKTKIYFVNVPNAAQTEFRVGYVTGLKFDALGDYYKAGVMNYPLGGAFNSRLNIDLREEKGWTYGARGYFDGDKYTGSYSFSAGIRGDATDSALTDIVRILTDYRAKGATSEELEFTRKSMGQSDARKYEAAFQKATFLSNILEYNLPSSYTKDQNLLLEKLTIGEVNQLASRYAPDLDKVNIVLVGDKAKVWDKLQKMRYEMLELDREGNPISSN